MSAVCMGLHDITGHGLVYVGNLVHYNLMVYVHFPGMQIWRGLWGGDEASLWALAS
jgi:hypothetical protein